jgi:transcription antitermination factor NusG
MNKNWYAVYTKAHCEKKVASLLTKKKIENFCPFNRRILNIQNNRKKIVDEVLFPSFVFIYITPSEIPLVKQTSDVINFLYWLGKPAVIKSAEIENIDLVINTYYNLKLEKTVVNPTGVIRIHDEQGTALKQSIIPEKKTNIKVTLPSLGYTIVTQTEKTIVESLNYGIESINAVI